LAASSAHARKRYFKRSGVRGGEPVLARPKHWSAHAHFSPYYVRSRQESITHAIEKRVREMRYKPLASLAVRIPKPGGGERELSINSIPDSALSYWLGKRLIERNSYRFSSYSYAYRADRNAHHAIQHLSEAIAERSRVFVVEFDFAKYFDSIRHDYLMQVLSDYRFQIEERELALLKNLLIAPVCQSVEDYHREEWKPRTHGIPQGSHMSLFLANVACHELDRELEKVGVSFARYADDTIVVCDSYAKADACADLLMSHGDRSGTAINVSKSPGISLLAQSKVAEMRTIQSVDFLSHKLSKCGIAIADKSIIRIKKRISRIIYNNLFLQVNRRQISLARFGPGFRDWDLVTCVNELRRYIYGKITEKQLSAALIGTGRVMRTFSAMSYYPTVGAEGASALRALDGWLLGSLTRAYSRRVRLLAGLGVTLERVAAQQLITGEWYSFGEVAIESKLPSFYRSWRYAKLMAKIYGLERLPSPDYDYI
jgi:RNA-directed DNA polymerase